MTTAQLNTMKISNDTLEVLKNYASINSNILVKPGQKLSTITPVKNVLSECEVAETFETEFGIWDLNKFLGTVSLFKDPEFTFDDKYVTIKSASNKSSVKFYYSEPSLLTVPPEKKIVMPSVVSECDITQSQFAEVLRAASILQLEDIAIRNDGNTIELVALDKKNRTLNNYSVVLMESDVDRKYTIYFRTENMKMLAGDYTVELTEKIVAKFSHHSRPLCYWVASEYDSKFE